MLLFSEQDKASAEKRVGLEFPPVATIRQVYEAVGNWFQIPVGSGAEFAADFNIYDFCRKQKLFIPTAINALKILQLNGYLMLTEASDHPSRVVFTVSRDDLYRVQVEREDLDRFIKVLLRTCTGIFSDFVAVNEHEIAHLSGCTPEQVHELFKRLWQLRIIKYIPGSRSSMIVYLDERLPQENLRISPESYRIRKEVAQGRLTAMIDYATNTRECRSLLLQHYFGDGSTEPCGKCDVCRERRRNSAEPLSESLRKQLLGLLSEREQTIHELVSAVQGEAPVILKEIRALTADRLIVQKPDGRIMLKTDL